MNVSCTQCQTVFRVDPAKVPADGVRARCSVCSGIFWVRRDAEVTTPTPVAPAPAAARPSAPMAPASPAPRPPVVSRPAVVTDPGVAPAAPYRHASPPAPAFSPPPAAAPAPPAPPRPAPAPPAPAPVAPPVPKPVFASAAPAPASGMSPAAPRTKRPANPFLSQDPEARARRLARALVSDIVVYHPAKRRDALRDGSLKLLFEEEIRKSWDEYVDQVGKPLADATTFFTDALNEILADGQPVFP